MARLLRFALVGGGCGLLQLVLLSLFVRWSTVSAAANSAAYLGTAQLNVVLSDRFIWSDRREGSKAWRRWFAFHTSIAGAFVVSQLVFLTALPLVPVTMASALGLALAALLNFAVQDRLTFRTSPWMGEPRLGRSHSPTWWF